jgi:hypothetical protein
MTCQARSRLSCSRSVNVGKAPGPVLPGKCLNIGSIEERVEDGRIFLTLTPRLGAQLNSSGIEECLGYMLRQVIKV